MTVYEYRVAYRLNDRAPRGAGLFHSVAEPVDKATRRLNEIKREMQKEGADSSYDEAWLERRPVVDWERTS